MAKTKFILTDHAKIRLKEREIEDPNGLRLTIAKNNARKKIIEDCPKNKVKKENVYFRTMSIPYTIYVCIAIGIGEYKLVTAFKQETNDVQN